MSFELELVKESITEEIKRTEHWDRPWNNGRLEGLKYSLGLVNIALGVEPAEALNEIQEVQDADHKN